MSKQFLKFKRKLLWIRLIKSILAGLAGGTATGGILYFLSLFEIIPMAPMLAWPIAGGAFLGVGVALFFLLRRTNAGLARRLDREFGLQERVQTAIAYRNEQSTMHQMQREDAEMAMEALSKKHLKFGKIWLYAVALCLGCLILAASLILKPLPVVPPTEDPEVEVIPYELSVLEEEALLILIEEVRASQMESPYRENIVVSLEDLLASLRVATIMDQRDAALTVCMETIHKETESSSQAIKVIEALWYSGNERVRKLAEAINFYDWSESDTLDERMEKFRIQLVPLSAADESTSTTVLLNETVDLLNVVIEDITVALTASGVKANDPLVKALYNLANNNDPRDTANYGLKGCLAKTSVGYLRLQSEWIAPKLTVHKTIVGNVLEVHVQNISTGEGAMTRLSEIFGWPAPDFARPQLVEESYGEDDDDTSTEGGGVSGGIGGGTVYGSDDLVLDPKTDTYVEYGTLLNDYYALMFGKGESGVYTEEEKELLEKYFQILYGTPTK